MDTHTGGSHPADLALGSPHRGQSFRPTCHLTRGSAPSSLSRRAELQPRLSPAPGLRYLPRPAPCSDLSLPWNTPCSLRTACVSVSPELVASLHSGILRLR